MILFMPFLVFPSEDLNQNDLVGKCHFLTKKSAFLVQQMRLTYQEWSLSIRISVPSQYQSGSSETLLDQKRLATNGAKNKARSKQDQDP